MEKEKKYMENDYMENDYKQDKCKQRKCILDNQVLVNRTNPIIREFKFDVKVEFTIFADCMDTIYKILCEIASSNISIDSYSYDEIDKNLFMMRIIIEEQSKPNLYAVKEILKDFNVKFIKDEVLLAIFLDENVGGYAILLNTINKISPIRYSYISYDGAIINVKSLRKVINELKYMS